MITSTPEDIDLLGNGRGREGTSSGTPLARQPGGGQHLQVHRLRITKGDLLGRDGDGARGGCGGGPGDEDGQQPAPGDRAPEDGDAGRLDPAKRLAPL